jgi:hydrogenase-4 component F
MTELLVFAAPALPLVVALAMLAVRSRRWLVRVNTAGAVLVAAAALALAADALTNGSHPALGGWYVVDGASGVFLGVIAVVGLLSALASPVYLGDSTRGFFGGGRSQHWYYAIFYVFWAALLLLPLLANLAAAWVVIEATTGASALLVAYSASPTALEAGWKYLVLTTFGLAVALLGILVLYTSLSGHGSGLHTLDWRDISHAARTAPHARLLLAMVLILAGLAAKIGWAPVHNWLPDAHSEAPPPVSAMLSAALLPTVMLVSWRLLTALGPAVGGDTGRDLFVAFGIASLAVAVPFLWLALPWKRLLAYSSLEHMGVLALGIAFGTPLALAGVLLHVAGHALAKSLGFYTAIPLQEHFGESSRLPARGLVGVSPQIAAATGLSLGTLAGLPPSPLFFSEVLILFGGFDAGYTVPAIIATILLALGFLGLAHALIEGLLGESDAAPWTSSASTVLVARLGAVVTTGLVALTAIAFLLPTWNLIPDLMRGIA